MQVKKQQLELDIEQRTGSKLGKMYVKAVYYYSAEYFCAEYIMLNTRLDEVQGGIKIAGRISVTSDTPMTPPLWQKAKKN